jgi:hypothetical protein
MWRSETNSRSEANLIAEVSIKKGGGGGEREGERKREKTGKVQI